VVNHPWPKKFLIESGTFYAKDSKIFTSLMKS